MRCMGCGGEMILMNVVPDDTMAVPGFEHHSFMCSECQDMEQRLVFTKYGREEAPEGMPIHAAPPHRAWTDVGGYTNCGSGSVWPRARPHTQVLASQSGSAPLQPWQQLERVIVQNLADFCVAESGLAALR
jgi:hypothetical protein